MNLKYPALFILLAAGLGLISVVYKIAITFWSDDMLLVFCVGCMFVSEYLSWINYWMERYWK